MSMNWIDIVIFVVVFWYAYQGWRAGLVYLAAGLVSFLASLVLAVRYFQQVGSFLMEKIGVPIAWASVAGYFVVAFLVETVFSFMFDLIIRRLPRRIVDSRANQLFGVVLGAINGSLIIAFLVLLILALPVRGTIKQDIRDSQVGSAIALLGARYGAPVESVIQNIRDEAVKFFTVAPGSRQRVSLDVAPSKANLQVDSKAEARMLELVNHERASAGVPVLSLDQSIVSVARAHSRDMFERRYFSHISPEGTDAGDRMRAGGVAFGVAGENLAYAPDIDTAHKGLMNSEGHKRNILDPGFTRIGIGVINADPYGMMFTQNFAD